MDRTIKILLFIAVFLLLKSGPGAFASSFSEYQISSFNTAVQSTPDSPGTKGGPLAFPDSRNAGRGINLTDSVCDTEIVDFIKGYSGNLPETDLTRCGKSKTLVTSRNINLLLQRKKIIYPFHSFL